MVAAIAGGEPLPHSRPLWALTLNRATAVGVLVLAVALLPPRPLDREAYPPLAAVGIAATVSVLGSLYPLATVVLARALVSLA
jgi:hypothetical protein